jgi:hypothetical protein
MHAGEVTGHKVPDGLAGEIVQLEAEGGEMTRRRHWATLRAQRRPVKLCGSFLTPFNRLAQTRVGFMTPCSKTGQTAEFLEC